VIGLWAEVLTPDGELLEDEWMVEDEQGLLGGLSVPLLAGIYTLVLGKVDRAKR
jgi:hypothetical protein